MADLLLDTNALIGVLDPADELFSVLLSETTTGSRCSTSSIAWHEFMRGPASPLDMEMVLGVLEGRVHPCTREDAEVAAFLFDKTGRRRSSTSDCLIAASAIRNGCVLVTRNLKDFQPFQSYGLSLY
jgi:predicted nucleic acid-binding protein